MRRRLTVRLGCVVVLSGASIAIAALAAGGDQRVANRGPMGLRSLDDIRECRGDLNRDTVVDQDDLGILLADWGCHGPGCPGDLDGDGHTDHLDLAILLSDFGNNCRRGSRAGARGGSMECDSCASCTDMLGNAPDDVDTITLTQDISYSGSAACITFGKDGMTFDGNGYSISGSGVGNGIDLTDRSVVIIQNVEISNFDVGIVSFSGSNNVLIQNNHVHDNSDTGIAWIFGNDFTVTGNAIKFNDFGIQPLDTNNNVIRNNIIEGNLVYGLFAVQMTNRAPFRMNARPGKMPIRRRTSMDARHPLCMEARPWPSRFSMMRCGS